MATKVKNSKKPRTKKTSPNTAGSARGYTQKAAAEANKGFQEMGIKTPWEKTKAKRLALRQAAGKTYANWEKKQLKLSKYKSNGKNGVVDGATYATHEVHRTSDYVR